MWSVFTRLPSVWASDLATGQFQLSPSYTHIQTPKAWEWKHTPLLLFSTYMHLSEWISRQAVYGLLWLTEAKLLKLNREVNSGVTLRSHYLSALGQITQLLCASLHSSAKGAQNRTYLLGCEHKVRCRMKSAWQVGVYRKSLILGPLVLFLPPLPSLSSHCGAWLKTGIYSTPGMYTPGINSVSPRRRNLASRLPWTTELMAGLLT